MIVLVLNGTAKNEVGNIAILVLCRICKKTLIMCAHTNIFPLLVTVAYIHVEKVMGKYTSPKICISLSFFAGK